MMLRLAALPMAAVISCDTTVNPTQVVTVSTPAQVAASPAPVVSPGAAVDAVTVEMFESTCPDPPLLRAGCIARVTATPRARGVTVPPEVHGPDCRWFLDGEAIAGVATTSVVQVFQTPNAFNVNVRAIAAGTFTLEAQVLAVRSGPRSFTVR